jgi:hypothetical protein
MSYPLMSFLDSFLLWLKSRLCYFRKCSLEQKTQHLKDGAYFLETKQNDFGHSEQDRHTPEKLLKIQKSTSQLALRKRKTVTNKSRGRDRYTG